jgi:hypothetical protein
MMRAMLKAQPIPTDESTPAQGSSAAKVLADYAAMSNEELSPNPPPGTERGSDSPLPVPGEGERSAGESRPREIGGRQGPEPTRFGDWEKSGRCIDF